MKKYFGILVLLIMSVTFMSCSSSQMGTTVPDSSPLVLEINHGTTKDLAFVKTMSWFNSTFNNAKSVISYQDKGLGTVIGKYLAYYQSGGQYTMEVTNYSIIEVTITEASAKIVVKPDYTHLPIFGKGSVLNYVKKENYTLLESFKNNF